MTQQFSNDNRGAIWKNTRKETDTHPDYTGSINAGGVDYWVSAWIKEGAKGKFMSLSVKAKDAAPAPAKPQAKAPAKASAGFDSDFDDPPF